MPADKFHPGQGLAVVMGMREHKGDLRGRTLFLHPNPVDRGKEVTDEVCSRPNSIFIDIAENPPHVQNAIMAMACGGYKIHVDPRTFPSN